MAQKAAKTLAARNTAILNRSLILTGIIHSVFWLLRFLIFRSSFTRKSLTLYILLTLPQLLIQFHFERNGRPSYGAQPGDLRRSGDDLEAKGLTEYMWDVTYWTYGCILLVAVAGDWAWWWWVSKTLRDPVLRKFVEI
jgi:hypothetical protein